MMNKNYKISVAKKKKKCLNDLVVTLETEKTFGNRVITSSAIFYASVT